MLFGPAKAMPTVAAAYFLLNTMTSPTTRAPTWTMQNHGVQPPKTTIETGSGENALVRRTLKFVDSSIHHSLKQLIDSQII